MTNVINQIKPSKKGPAEHHLPSMNILATLPSKKAKAKENYIESRRVIRASSAEPSPKVRRKETAEELWHFFSTVFIFVILYRFNGRTDSKWKHRIRKKRTPTTFDIDQSWHLAQHTLYMYTSKKKECITLTKILSFNNAFTFHTFHSVNFSAYSIVWSKRQWLRAKELFMSQMSLFLWTFSCCSKPNRLETGVVYEFCLRPFVNDVNEIKLWLFVIRRSCSYSPYCLLGI